LQKRPVILRSLLIVANPYPTWVDIFECCFKAQSSKLERLFCHVSVKRDVRDLSFVLGNSFSKLSPKVGLVVQEPRSERDQIDDSEFQGNDTNMLHLPH